MKEQLGVLLELVEGGWPASEKPVTYLKHIILEEADMMEKLRVLLELVEDGGRHQGERLSRSWRIKLKVITVLLILNIFFRNVSGYIKIRPFLSNKRSNLGF